MAAQFGQGEEGQALREYELIRVSGRMGNGLRGGRCRFGSRRRGRGCGACGSWNVIYGNEDYRFF